MATSSLSVSGSCLASFSCGSSTGFSSTFGSYGCSFGGGTFDSSSGSVLMWWCRTRKTRETCNPSPAASGEAANGTRAEHVEHGPPRGYIQRHNRILEHGFFRRLYLLRCEYFFDVRMNGGGCDRCVAWTMVQGAPTPEKIMELFVLPPTLTYPDGPLHSALPIPPSVPPAPTRKTCRVCVSRCTRLACAISAAAFGGRVTRSACVARSARSAQRLCRCLWNCYWCLACSTQSHFSTISFCDAIKISTTAIRP